MGDQCGLTRIVGGKSHSQHTPDRPQCQDEIRTVCDRASMVRDAGSRISWPRGNTFTRVGVSELTEVRIWDSRGAVSLTAIDQQAVVAGDSLRPIMDAPISV